MRKHVAAVRLVERDEATEAVELPEELRLSLGAIAGVAREGLLAMCTRVGLAVVGEMMTAEMTAKVGSPKHAKLAQRQGDWHGSAPGRSCEDRFIVRRLGIGRRLAASLRNTNCIQSMLSIARDMTRNVKRWRDGKLSKRWRAAGMRNAERSFRRLKGYRQMSTFVAALAHHGESC